MAFGKHQRSELICTSREWMPGAGFQRKAREWKEAVYEMRDAPYATARQALVSFHMNPVLALYHPPHTERWNSTAVFCL